MKNIPFNKPHVTQQDHDYIKNALLHTNLAGDGPYTKKCHHWFEKKTHVAKALLTHSCTAALEMAALLLDLKPGDEVIMPSYTFVSTANAFVLRGAVPVFIDIRPDTLNMDEKLIEYAITSKTKAIVPVHYAGVACEMDTILAIAKRYNLAVVEDAAQGAQAFYKGKALGAIGDMGCLSFHATKNIISGEGGALFLRDETHGHYAEIIREKGTDRAHFLNGQIDKYTWQSIGSSYLPSEVTAAFLLSQLEQIKEITQKRLDIWRQYHQQLEELENKELMRRPMIPEECDHNAHMYYILVNHKKDRAKIIEQLKERGIHCVYHYVPLHSSPAGKKYAKTYGDLSYTNDLSERIIRLPLWFGLCQKDVFYIIDNIRQIMANI